MPFMVADIWIHGLVIYMLSSILVKKISVFFTLEIIIALCISTYLFIQIQVMTRPSKRKQFLKKLANQIRRILHENDTSYNAQDYGWESELLLG